MSTRTPSQELVVRSAEKDLRAALTDPTRYPIPAARHTVEQVIDRSRFLATLDRAATPDEAHAVLREVAALHPDATHHALAFVAGPPGSTTHVGMSDAGEPHGTAGRPMLTVLLHGGVGDIVAVCTRWYGGTKLGTGGLARAYGGTVHLALRSLPRAEHVDLVPVEIIISYPYVTVTQQLMATHEVTVDAQEFGAEVRFRLRLPVNNAEPFTNALRNATHGTARFESPA